MTLNFKPHYGESTYQLFLNKLGEDKNSVAGEQDLRGTIKMICDALDEEVLALNAKRFMGEINEKEFRRKFEDARNRFEQNLNHILARMELELESSRLNQYREGAREFINDLKEIFSQFEQKTLNHNEIADWHKTVMLDRCAGLKNVYTPEEVSQLEQLEKDVQSSGKIHFLLSRPYEGRELKKSMEIKVRSKLGASIPVQMDFYKNKEGQIVCKWKAKKFALGGISSKGIAKILAIATMVIRENDPGAQIIGGNVITQTREGKSEERSINSAELVKFGNRYIELTGDDPRKVLGSNMLGQVSIKDKDKWGQKYLETRKRIAQDYFGIASHKRQQEWLDQFLPSAGTMDEGNAEERNRVQREMFKHASTKKQAAIIKNLFNKKAKGVDERQARIEQAQALFNELSLDEKKEVLEEFKSTNDNSIIRRINLWMEPSRLTEEEYKKVKDSLTSEPPEYLKSIEKLEELEKSKEEIQELQNKLENQEESEQAVEGLQKELEKLKQLNLSTDQREKRSKPGQANDSGLSTNNDKDKVEEEIKQAIRNLDARKQTLLKEFRAMTLQQKVGLLTYLVDENKLKLASSLMASFTPKEASNILETMPSKQATQLIGEIVQDERLIFKNPLKWANTINPLLKGVNEKIDDLMNSLQTLIQKGLSSDTKRKVGRFLQGLSENAFKRLVSYKALRDEAFRETIKERAPLQVLVKVIRDLLLFFLLGKVPSALEPLLKKQEEEGISASQEKVLSILESLFKKLEEKKAPFFGLLTSCVGQVLKEKDGQKNLIDGYKILFNNEKLLLNDSNNLGELKKSFLQALGSSEKGVETALGIWQSQQNGEEKKQVFNNLTAEQQRQFLCRLAKGSSKDNEKDVEAAVSILKQVTLEQAAERETNQNIPQLHYLYSGLKEDKETEENFKKKIKEEYSKTTDRTDKQILERIAKAGGFEKELGALQQNAQEQPAVY